MQQWEYMYVTIAFDNKGVLSVNADHSQVKGWDRRLVKEVFQHLGAQGWELVTGQLENSTHHLYFKRPKV